MDSETRTPDAESNVRFQLGSSISIDESKTVNTEVPEIISSNSDKKQSKKKACTDLRYTRF